MADLLIKGGDPGPGRAMLSITPERAGWQFVGFDAIRLAPGKTGTWRHSGREACLVLLSGGGELRVAIEKLDGTVVADGITLTELASRDPELYDLVLSTERLSVDECVEEVESLMKKKCFQETPESVLLAHDLSIEWSVRSALRRDPRTAATSITVECADGVVSLAGMVETEVESNAAAELAAATEGAAGVRNQLKASDSASSRFRREG